jgi:hypothetical protein
LINQFGIKNWTVIADKINDMYSKKRSGKQCRERWHNHLDPNINKNDWTEREENILFAKHSEYGNKWSNIAEFLPGRTDNSIKNHFYSKLRKYIRKLLKILIREQSLKAKSVDLQKYNSDILYKMIKSSKITFELLSPEVLLDIILKFENKNKTSIKKKNKRDLSPRPRNIEILKTKSIIGFLILIEIKLKSQKNRSFLRSSEYYFEDESNQNIEVRRTRDSLSLIINKSIFYQGQGNQAHNDHHNLNLHNMHNSQPNQCYNCNFYKSLFDNNACKIANLTPKRKSPSPIKCK